MAINDSRGKVTLDYLEGVAQDIVELILLLCLRGATLDNLMPLLFSGIMCCSYSRCLKKC
jgi:hypothetical protein